jgi:hypothetical protein
VSGDQPLAHERPALHHLPSGRQLLRGSEHPAHRIEGTQAPARMHTLDRFGEALAAANEPRAIHGRTDRLLWIVVSFLRNAIGAIHANTQGPQVRLIRVQQRPKREAAGLEGVRPQSRRARPRPRPHLPHDQTCGRCLWARPAGHPAHPPTKLGPHGHR